MEESSKLDSSESRKSSRGLDDTSTMKKLTKKQAAAARKADWAKALLERRVIRIHDGETFKSFPTVAARDEYTAKLTRGTYEVVDPIQ